MIIVSDIHDYYHVLEIYKLNVYTCVLLVIE